MFKFNIAIKLEKKLNKLSKKDKILAKIFERKIIEIVNNDETTINRYKNLKAPHNDLKRIHLTDNYILLFHVNIKYNHILFLNILHRDYAYT